MEPEERTGSLPTRMAQTRKPISLPGNSLPGYLAEASVAPDGQRLVFTEGEGGVRRLLEIGADGTGLREIRKLDPDEFGFIWTPDGKYLVYQSGSARQSDIWLLPMRMLFRRPGKPVRLTNGPLPYSYPYPSRMESRLLLSAPSNVANWFATT
jgi:Tol biopolymer transport system component